MKQILPYYNRGAAFENMLQQNPRSALLAAGSEIAVMPGRKIRSSAL
ncbi:hypothetical protein [Chitinophaga niastensis]|nr:hypothetical protein [Chitinophaga niastensis]